MCSHKTSHVDVKLNVLDEMEKLMKLLTSADYDQTCLRYKIAPRGWDVIEGGSEGTSLEVDRSLGERKPRPSGRG